MAAPTPERHEPLLDTISSAVNAYVRDLARGELSLRLASRETLSLAPQVQHTATFSEVIAVGEGALPATIASVSSFPDFEAQLQQRLEQVRQEAGALLDLWAAQEAREYRARLPPDRCMVKRPALGVQETCATCLGNRQVTCPTCRGARRLTCAGCGKSGRVACVSCGGAGSRSCSACGGSCTYEVREFEATYSDRQNTMNQQNVLVRRVPCQSCGGRGQIPCADCSDGTQTCGACSGAGIVNCGQCSAAGVVPCDTCAATGITHRTGWVRCDVERQVHIDIANTNQEDLHTLRNVVPFDHIAAMADQPEGVSLQGTRRNGHQLSLSYAASTLVERAEAVIGGQSLVISAYGVTRQIFDYHGVAERLMEPDLADLEKSLADGSLYRANPAASLAGITGRVLSSKLHALVAEAPALPNPTAANAASRPRVPLGLVLRHAFLLKPTIRFWKRRGLFMKIILLIVALRLAIEPTVVLNYLFLVCVSAFYEWRYQRAGAPEHQASADTDTPLSLEAQATQRLEAPIAVGMVSRGYLQRARSAIGRAVPRLYGPLVMPMALWITAGVAVLQVIARNALFQWTPVEKTMVLLVLTGMAWFVTERMAAAQLRTMLNAELYERLKGRFTEARLRYRLVPIGAFVVAWYLADFVIRLIVYARFGVPIIRP
jgi:hypothetical protein